MARRSQLKGTAVNLVQFCTSRNFDCEGYWAIGKFYTFARSNETDSVALNLLDYSIYPEYKNNRFVPAVKTLSDLFEQNASANGIPTSWVSNVVVLLRFNAEYQERYHSFGASMGGNPYVCTASISTDLGKEYRAEDGGNVWQHNPHRERRRVCVASQR